MHHQAAHQHRVGRLGRRRERRRGRRRGTPGAAADRSRGRSSATPEVVADPAVGTGDELEHVERLPSFVNEGHLYRSRQQHFLIYTGESGRGWDACATATDRSGHWTFGRLLAIGASRDDVVAKLRAVLDVEGIDRSGPAE